MSDVNFVPGAFPPSSVANGADLRSRPSQGSFEETGSFAKLLGGGVGEGSEFGRLNALNDALARNAQSKVEGSGIGSADRYSSDVQIGEAALAFSARPIVAPSALTYHSQRPIEPRLMGAEPRWVPSIPARLSGAFNQPSELAMPTHSAGDSGWVTGMRLPALPSEPIRSAASLPGTVNRVQASSSRVITTPFRATIQLAQGETQPPSSREAGRSATPALVSTAVANPEAIALFQLGAQEYRLSLRGTRLAQDQRERLIADINLALIEWGMPLHPLRFAQPAWER